MKFLVARRSSQTHTRFFLQSITVLTNDNFITTRFRSLQDNDCKINDDE